MKNTTVRHTIIKLFENNDEEKILSFQRKRHITGKETKIKMTIYFSLEIMHV